MNRNKIIAFVVTVVGLSAIIGITMYLLSFHNVTFTITNKDLKVVIYSFDDTEKKQKLAEAGSGETLRLREGKYAAFPMSDEYDKSPTVFSLEKSDLPLSITASYSQDRLKTLLSEEQSTINSVINTKYTSNIKSFTLENGKLYNEGQWYATTLVQVPADRRENGDIYHIIMLKKDDIWTIINKPSLVLTTAEFKDVPLAILQDANRMGD